MLSDDEFSRRLDVSLVPVTKSFLIPPPLTDRFADNPILSASHVHTTTPVAAPCDASDRSASPFYAIARAECVSRVEGLQQWLDRAQQGRRMGEESNKVLQSLSECLASMQDVTGAVREQSDNLSSNASALMVQKTKLELVLEELQRMIHHYTHIEDLAREAEHPTLSPTSARYPTMLQEIEEEMYFLSRNPQFFSSKAYATKLALAQERAHQRLREALVASMQTAQAATVESEEYKNAFYQPQGISPHVGQKEVEQDKTNQHEEEEGEKSEKVGEEEHHFDKAQLQLMRVDTDIVAEGYKRTSDALALVNAFFFSKLEEKSSLRRMIEARNSDYARQDEDLLDAEILDAYREVRVGLVGPLLQDSLSALCPKDAAERSLPRLVAHIAVLMRMTLAREKELFDDVWLREDFSVRVFTSLVTGISNEVYDVFRSRLLQVDDIAELAFTIEEIQRANVRQDAVAEIGGLLTKMVQDAQERLFFRTSVFLRQSIVRCIPTQAMALEFLKDRAGDAQPRDATLDADDLPLIGVSSLGVDRKAYIPALKNCVGLLQLLYPSLEFSVFSVFAEEAIHCALTQVQEMAKLISRQRAEHAVLKGLMCQLQHLLYLREELSGIDENITVIEKRIDLTKITQRRIEIVQYSRESKKDVEGEIKIVCERIVQQLISEISSPLAGIARKGANEISAALEAVEGLRRTRKTILEAYFAGTPMQEALLRPVDTRIDELLAEVVAVQRQENSQAQEEKQKQKTEELIASGDGNGVPKPSEHLSGV